MKIVKPSWVCSKDPLFSCDVHPDGTKFVTGGQGEGNGKIVIWNLAPVAKRKAEMSNLKKTIATLEHHQGCVNCVRWSNGGEYLASAGDDKVVMVWGAVRYEGADSESYKCLHILRGHNGDVLDIAWSHDDRYLASTSIDNTVIIWNCHSFPDRLTTIRGHDGMVKGVVWDPIGRYLATQSADKTLRVWRLTDWLEETRITAPFAKCGGTTSVLRIGWSPDGQYIVSSHAMNNEGPVAKIIEREEWNARMDFVGHRRAIESVRFNPHLFYYEKMPVSCVAIAGRDSSVSVWLTSLQRPLFVLHDAFTSSVLDMSWTPDGYGLLVCSLDGTLAFIELSVSELGRTLSSEQIANLRTNMYGNISHDKLTIIEDPDLLNSEDDSDKGSSESEMDTAEGEEMDTAEDNTAESESSSKENGGGFPAANGHGTTMSRDVIGQEQFEKFSSRFENSSSSKQVSSITAQQVETTTKEGRRRIMPVTLKELPLLPQKQSVPSSKRVILTPVSNTSSSTRPNTPGPAKQDNVICLRDMPVKLSKRTRLEPANAKATTNTPAPANNKLFAILQDSRIEIDNKKKQVKFTRNSRSWCSAVCSSVATMSCGDTALVIGCQDGSVYVFDKEGVLLLPVLNVGSSISKSAARGSYVAVVTCVPALFVWNVKDKRNVLKDERLSSFLSAGRTISSVELSKEGNVTIGLCEGTRYCYSYTLLAWMLLSQDKLGANWYKDLQANRPTADTEQVLTGLLAQSAAAPTQPRPAQSEEVYLSTVGLHEQHILVAENLGSLSEARVALSALVRYMTLQQDEERLRSLLQRLLATHGDMIYGSDKLALMKTLLKIVASNVNCQRLYSDIKQQVEWVETRP